MTQLDPALIALLSLDPSTARISSTSGGGMSSARTSKITTPQKSYFLKTATGPSAERMFRGEHASLNAIASIVPTLCPRSYGHGTYTSSPNTSFLVTDYLDLTSRSAPSSNFSQSLASKLASLHSTPAPIPEGHTTPQFGFPVPTSCGDTLQQNTFSPSWPDFFATSRLTFILTHAEETQGKDPHLRTLVEETCSTVVPRLLSPSHLNNGNGITPVVVHGDLWSGNAGMAHLPTMASPHPEEVVFDSSACYAHSEYELGIMKMFGGFGSRFLDDYHRQVPKTEPVAEYDDRVRLYECYHHLNHYALFGGGYKRGAEGIMSELIEKYGGGGVRKGES